MLNQTWRRHEQKYRQSLAIALVVIFAAVGVAILRYGGAATPTVNIEPEVAALSGGAQTVNDTTASGGKAVKFNQASASPSGAPMPVGDLPGWRQIFADDFTKDAALGSWGSDCDASKIVYIGSTGTQWKAYPKCYLDTYNKYPYRSDAVLSVGGGVLDFWLHNVDGIPAGANPAPVLNNATGSMYQTYGRYSARFRLDTNSLSEYYTAWLLWPQNDSDWQCAESDYPEGSLTDLEVSAFAHYGCSGSQDYFHATLGSHTEWHTYTQEWGPGFRKYYLDNTLLGTSTKSVYAGPERWQLQTETKGSGTNSGHLQVDWVVVYSYVP